MNVIDKTDNNYHSLFAVNMTLPADTALSHQSINQSVPCVCAVPAACETWMRPATASNVLVPSGRRGHTAVITNHQMHIYGGFLDIKGSSSELWTYDLGKQDTIHFNQVYFNIPIIYSYNFIET